MPLVLGVLALAIAVWFAKSYLKADPKRLSAYGKKAGGAAALGAGGVLFLRGRVDMALPLAALGAWLLGLRIPIWPWYVPAQGSGANGGRRTACLDIEPGYETGGIRARILSGPFAGRALDGLSADELTKLAAYLFDTDREGLGLVQSYLDSRAPRWREAMQGHANARQRGGGGPGILSKEEAYEILGLQIGASEEEIRKAHLTLMQKFHPDQAGSTWLATRINMARDVLLNAHR